MSFVQREIRLQFSSAKGVVTLDGLRCHAVVMNPGGYQSFGNLQLRVYGMSLDQMNQYSSTGMNMAAANNQSVTVMAGDAGAPLSKVFEGSLIRSFIDFQPPEVAFVCSAVAGWYQKAAPSAPNSYQGTANAEDIIAGLAKQAGFAFVNRNGAHAVLQNQYLYGSLVDQMQTVARAASLPLCIENGTVTIWPNQGVRDDVVIEVSPETGLVGYPTFWEAGFEIKTLFNPNILNGRTVKLTSSIPKANGNWPTQNVTHELSTLQANGPWFTTVRLSPSVYVPVN